MRMFFCFAVVFCLTVVLWFSYVVIILSTQPLTHLVIRCGLHHDVLTDDDRTATSFHFLDSSFLSAFCAHWSALVCQRRHAKLVSRWVGGSYIVSRPKYGRWRVSTSHITAQPVLCFLTLTDQTNIFQDCHQQHDMTSFSCRQLHTLLPRHWIFWYFGIGQVHRLSCCEQTSIESVWFCN